MKNKVVYGWYSDQEIFYVGIGSLNRSSTTKGRNLHCSRKRAKAEREGTFEVKILYSGLTWDQACEIECQLISQYGRLDLGTGCLTNMTNGGEGGSPNKQRKFSKLHRDNIRQSQKKNEYACKSVMTPKGRFKSNKDAYQSYQVTKQKFSQWLNDPQKTEFYRM